MGGLSFQCQLCTPWTTTTALAQYSTSSRCWLIPPSTPPLPPRRLQSPQQDTVVWRPPLLQSLHAQSLEKSSCKSKSRTGAPPSLTPATRRDTSTVTRPLSSTGSSSEPSCLVQQGKAWPPTGPWKTGQTCERDGDVKLGGAADQGGHDRGGERGDQGHAGKRHTPTAKDFQIPAEQTRNVGECRGNPLYRTVPAHQDQEGRQLRQQALQRLPLRWSGFRVPGSSRSGPRHRRQIWRFRAAGCCEGQIPKGRCYGPPRQPS